ncbi:hypothetical protein [Calothrix sp. 336/3]|nr:hypothetical protein [Calothrix sp. 336/3]
MIVSLVRCFGVLILRYPYGTLRDRLLKIEIEHQKRRYYNYYKISS